MPPRPFSWVNCSALNADCQYVAIPVELADGTTTTTTTAVARAESVHIGADDEQRYRVGHHWVAVARAWVLHGNRTKPLEAGPASPSDRLLSRDGKDDSLRHWRLTVGAPFEKRYSRSDLTKSIAKLFRIECVSFDGQAERHEPHGSCGLRSEGLLPVEYW